MSQRYGLRFYALAAGFGCISLAAFVQGVLPMLEPQSRTTRVTMVVRTDLGELKWMEGHATDYTPLQQRGRNVYVREGCWYCHSQYVRPVAGETRQSRVGSTAKAWPHQEARQGILPVWQTACRHRDRWPASAFAALDSPLVA